MDEKERSETGEAGTSGIHEVGCAAIRCSHIALESEVNRVKRDYAYMNIQIAAEPGRPGRHKRLGPSLCS